MPINQLIQSQQQIISQQWKLMSKLHLFLALLMLVSVHTSQVNGKDKKMPRITAKGSLLTYSKQKSIAYRTNVHSNKYIVFIDGMNGNILNIAYFQALKHYCDSNNIVLVYPQLRTHPNYRLYPIENDIEDIKSLIKLIDGQIVLLGCSTGAQGSLLYAKSGKSQKIKALILQAPVSDPQAGYMEDPKLKQTVEKAKRINKQFFTYQNNTWLTERFITVNEQRNKQDLFSSYLEDQLYAQWKPYGPILSILSEKDQYTPEFAKKILFEKFKLMGQVAVIKNAEHHIENKQSQKEFIKVVDAFLRNIKFIKNMRH